MDQKTYIGKKIRENREAKKWTSAQLGAMLSNPKSDRGVLSWENGRTTPDADTLIELCILFGIEISEFYYKSPQYMESAITATSNEEDWVDVPLYGSIAAGTPIEMMEVEDVHSIPAVVAGRYPNAFLLKVEGDSMSRILPDGSYALVNPCSQVDHDGKPYAVCVNGYDATIKRVHHLNNGFELIPDSIDPTYAPVVYNYNDPGTDTITIIGEVVYYVLPDDWSF